MYIKDERVEYLKRVIVAAILMGGDTEKVLLIEKSLEVYYNQKRSLIKVKIGLGLLIMVISR